ncbi:hypothetical protein [Frigoribacterium sp. UYMn621]|uniref:hypothetical protein n=1 Tax=Frigoribacterium sp. UYMn621 TaxID=3156343 RepID=UPI003394579C
MDNSVVALIAIAASLIGVLVGALVAPWLTARLNRDGTQSDFIRDQRREAYADTTLGTVLLEKATNAQVNVGEYYDRANFAFERAARWNTGDGSLITWLAYLRYSVRLLAKLSRQNDASTDAEKDGLLERIREDWIRVYAQLAIMRESSDRVRRDLSDLQRDYGAVGFDIS